MHIRVLGAAAGGGLPQWNCRCEVCRLAWAGDPRVTPRTQSSIAVSADGHSWALINCAPEVLTQIRQTPALFPQQGRRHTPIASVLVTNGDIDHIGGLLSLRESSPYRLYATPEIHTALGDSPVFNVLNPDHVERCGVELEQTLELAEGLEARIFAVPGKAALYLEGDDVEIGGEGEATVGVEFRVGERRAYYIPGCATLTERLAARLEGADLVMFDGTLWRDDEMIRAGVGHKTGLRMGHMSMAGNDGSMAALASLNLGRRVFVHINNTNPVLIEGSPERQEAERQGWEISYDGMELEC
ncbi:pyrroloquinoline quinone biosynthesis protein PqqB [Halomonas caseinilytica]|uniref:pyrroloquinoline quinone biosynthesis protein PqqB n=1 Tax=Halomonas caseinilytica TaxID=438744 RepID=UPI0007E56985|nr:pyrroloquinoline quinone biosynthesis protein PqqB [Halomonas caseinilytica]SEM58788.1 pyrroloquinoline quinone biosynthesis protein B [Halomonas caseinilytica]